MGCQDRATLQVDASSSFYLQPRRLNSRANTWFAQFRRAHLACFSFKTPRFAPPPLRRQKKRVADTELLAEDLRRPSHGFRSARATRSTRQVNKVTLVPRGQAKGLTWFTPGEDQSLVSSAMLKAGGFFFGGGGGLRGGGGASGGFLFFHLETVGRPFKERGGAQKHQ